MYAHNVFSLKKNEVLIRAKTQMNPENIQVLIQEASHKGPYTV